ncbi:MAG: hypothetical protein LBQ28_03940 [Prevotellaceae bacterium]|jgi:hypothetical protein|nr:hypothetical protein [Prevotellaceae bacterium]
MKQIRNCSSKKRGVKLQKHLNNLAGRAETSENGQDPRSRKSGKVKNNNAYQMHKKVPRVWANYNEENINDFSSRYWL